MPSDETQRVVDAIAALPMAERALVAMWLYRALDDAALAELTSIDEARIAQRRLAIVGRLADELGLPPSRVSQALQAIADSAASVPPASLLTPSLAEAHPGEPALRADRRPSLARLSDVALVMVATAVSPVALLLGVIRTIWRRPSIIAAMVLLLVCVPTSGGAPSNTAAAHITLADLAAVGLALIVAMRALTTHGLGRIPSGMALAVLALVIGALLSLWGANNDHDALTGAVRYLEVFVAVPLAVALAVRTRRDVIIVLGALIACGLLEGAIGVVQYLTGSGAGYGTSSVRAVGTFGAYDIMGMATIVTYAIVVALAVRLGGPRGATRGLLGLVAIALLAPLAFSLSRGSWLAFLIAALITLFVTNWRRALVISVTALLVATAGLGLAPGALKTLSSRASTIASAFSSPDRSIRDRYDLWQAALRMWSDHPVTGVGLRNFPIYLDTSASLDLPSGSAIQDQAVGYQVVQLLSPHDMYLLVLSEQGLFGILALLTLLLTLMRLSLRRLRATPAAGPERVLIITAIAFGVRFMAEGIWADNIGGPDTVASAVMLGLLFWAAAGRPLDSDAPSTSPSHSLSPMPTELVAMS